MTDYVPWHQRTLCCVDLETTGKDPETARIVTAAVLILDPTEGDITTHEWLANPGVDIPDEAAKIHGITTSMAVADGRPADEVVNEIAGHLAEYWHRMCPVIAYNAAYDLTVIDRELRRHRGEELFTGTVIDPFVIDKQYHRYRPGSRKLVDVARHYGVPLNAADAHGAAADALAAGRVAWKLAHVFPEVGRMRLPELHAHQIEWYAEQATSLQRHFNRKGIDETVSLEWPVRTYRGSKAGVA